MRHRRTRVAVLGLAVGVMLALAVPAIADSWQEGMLPAPPLGQEAPYYHSMACDINGDGEGDFYGQEYVDFLWKADGKTNKDGNWEGKIKFSLNEVVYNYMDSEAKPDDLPDAIVATGTWVIDGVFTQDPSADLDAFLAGPDPVEAEFDWDMKLRDQDGVFIAKTGGTIDLLNGVVDSYGPCSEP